jgi:hypothetical protein
MLRAVLFGQIHGNFYHCALMTQVWADRRWG